MRWARPFHMSSLPIRVFRLEESSGRVVKYKCLPFMVGEDRAVELRKPFGAKRSETERGWGRSENGVREPMMAVRLGTVQLRLIPAAVLASPGRAPHGGEGSRSNHSQMYNEVLTTTKMVGHTPDLSSGERRSQHYEGLPVTQPQELCNARDNLTVSTDFGALVAGPCSMSGPVPFDSAASVPSSTG
jgi:hypothetical protein